MTTHKRWRTYERKADCMPSLVKALQDWLKVELIDRYDDYDNIDTIATSNALAEDIWKKITNGDPDIIVL